MARRGVIVGGRIVGMAFLLASSLQLLEARPARGLVVELDEWSAEFEGGVAEPFSFTEDFEEDGVLSSSLFAFCGSVAPEDVGGGVLTLRRPSFAPGCSGQQGIFYSYADQGQVTARASYRFEAPPILGEAYGVSVADANALDFASLSVSLFPVGEQLQLNVAVADENFNPLIGNFVEILVLPGPASALSFDTVDLELVMTLVDGLLLPHGRVSFDGGPFQDLGPNDQFMVPEDRGAIPGSSFVGSSIFVNTVPEPASALLLAAGLIALCGRPATRRSR